jgi:imidazolonepropionase-like amidohydrolase
MDLMIVRDMNMTVVSRRPRGFASLSLWLCLFLAVITLLCESPTPAKAGDMSAETIHAFINGRWFNGTGFTKGTWYSAQGRLSRTKPDATAIETIDLAGAYVVPPFGEAHNHNIEGEWNAEAIIARYLKDGVFYVKNPNDVRDLALKIKNKINSQRTIDVAFAHAGLTGSGGHPIALYEDILRRNRYDSVIGPLAYGWFENRAYVVINTEQDLHDKWALITDGNPDFVKAYLARSENEQAGAIAPGRHGTHHARTGVNPALLPVIVAKAHGARLRVSVHVETAADFRTAVQAGADEIAHLPGWLVESAQDIAQVRLSEEDARLAAKTQVVVVTTTVAGEAMPGNGNHSPPHADDQAHTHVAAPHTQARDVQRDNLKLLHRYGVKLAVGSDHAETSLAEALNLKTLDVFDNVTLLNLWCEATPAAIFPGRKIGRFAEGYEASFLALEGDPLRDFEYVRRIRLRVKQGVVLDGPRQ